MTTWLVVGGAVLCLLLSYLLTAADAAFRRISPSHVKNLVDDGRRGSSHLRRISDDPATHLAVISFVRVTLEMTAAVLVTLVFASVYGVAWQTVVWSVVVMVIVSFVIVGVSPNTIGIQHAESVSLAMAPAVVRLRKVFAPFARLLIALGNAVTPGKGYRDGQFESEAELRDIVDLAGQSSIIEEEERTMLHSVIDLGDTVVREIMVPRTDMITIGRDKKLSQAMSLFLRSGVSRVPVIGASSDDTLGLLYFRDVSASVYGDHDAQWRSVTEAMRPVPYVPESKSVDLLLREMQRDQTHMAVVIDEYGGTAGLVTIEDIIEEIVGEIVDEYDPEERRIEEAGHGRYRVPASMDIDDLAELFGITFDDEDSDDVDTVGGLLAKALGRVPLLGASTMVGGVQLTADRMSGRRHRIDTILAERVATEEADAQEGGAPGGDAAPGEQPAATGDVVLGEKHVNAAATAPNETALHEAREWHGGATQASALDPDDTPVTIRLDFPARGGATAAGAASADETKGARP